MNRKHVIQLSPESQARRAMVLFLSIGLLVGALLAWWFGDKTWSTFASAAMGRIGLVMAALWLAWPSLTRPARWLPPGIAVACVLGLIVLAAQPRLVVFVLPAIGVLTFLATIARGIRGRK
ncbi:hypothetical protein [Planctomycetes bacterium K23_9]|uniref:Uncharacterized protein n=1 Tax=Stieleria marina TaxID=1930275 RepID=A0A517NR49_9BACT|nr:hypothetical protein K239x_15400 [Planctomycetes bacterium K23_9]